MASFLFPRKKYMYYNEGGFLKMEINKIISISCGTAVAGIMAVTGVLLYKKKEKDDLNKILKLLEMRDDVQDIALDACNKCISKLNKRIDSLEKSNKK